MIDLMGASTCVVLPVISAWTGTRCLRSAFPNIPPIDTGEGWMDDNALGVDRSEMLVVDNTRAGFTSPVSDIEVHRDPAGHNLGVARAWNIGARRVLERGLDYLTLLSSGVEFGPMLHTNWKWRLGEFRGALIIECEGHSWHLIAIHRTVFETIGLFDENFYPAYEEAIDFGYRMRMAELEGVDHVKAWVNAVSWATGMHREMVTINPTALLDYYAEKWGGPKGTEEFTTPFGKGGPLDYWSINDIPTLAARYELETWW